MWDADCAWFALIIERVALASELSAACGRANSQSRAAAHEGVLWCTVGNAWITLVPHTYHRHILVTSYAERSSHTACYIPPARNAQRVHCHWTMVLVMARFVPSSSSVFRIRKFPSVFRLSSDLPFSVYTDYCAAL